MKHYHGGKGVGLFSYLRISYCNNIKRLACVEYSLACWKHRSGLGQPESSARAHHDTKAACCRGMTEAVVEARRGSHYHARSSRQRDAFDQAHSTVQAPTFRFRFVRALIPGDHASRGPEYRAIQTPPIGIGLVHELRAQQSKLPTGARGSHRDRDCRGPEDAVHPDRTPNARQALVGLV